MEFKMIWYQIEFLTNRPILFESWRSIEIWQDLEFTKTRIEYYRKTFVRIGQYRIVKCELITESQNILE